MRLVVWALLLLAAPLAAQPLDAADRLRAVREATARLDYASAEARAREALANPAGLAPDDLVEIHAALGVVLHARGADVEAREQFLAALSINPALALDSVLVSPRTLDLLENVRAAAGRTDAPTSAVRYVVLVDRRPAAALRSAVLPGWGQLHKGDRGRGLAFAAGVGAAAIGTAVAHGAYNAARDRYRAATTREAAIETYAEANRLYRLRGVLGVAVAAGWTAAVVEALLTGAPRAPSNASSTTVRLASGRLALHVRL